MRFFDLHCDTLYNMVKENKDIYKNNFHVDMFRSQKYSPYVGCFAVWIPDDFRGDNAYKFFNKAVQKLYAQENKYGKYFKICKSFEDIEDLKNQSGVILTVEGGAALAGNIDNVQNLHNFGVKIMTLTWNGICEIGGGSECSEGLSSFGKAALKEMEKVGIIADLSHASEKLFYDVSEIASKPFTATHSNSRSICNHKRNLTDEQFNIIKSVNGLVGITFCNYFLKSNEEATFDDIRKHIEHFLEMGGENILAIGSDFDGADIPSEIKGIESLEDIYDYFLKKSYKEELLNKIFFYNAYNFMRKNMI